jgi:hypothetical protein
VNVDGLSLTVDGPTNAALKSPGTASVQGAENQIGTGPCTPIARVGDSVSVPVGASTGEIVTGSSDAFAC